MSYVEFKECIKIHTQHVIPLERIFLEGLVPNTLNSQLT